MHHHLIFKDYQKKIKMDPTDVKLGVRFFVIFFIKFSWIQRNIEFLEQNYKWEGWTKYRNLKKKKKHIMPIVGWA